MKWKTDEQQYAIGSILYAGKWPVGGAHYDGARNRHDPKKYKATCALPGIKRELGYFETDEEARAVAESAVNYWMVGLPANVEKTPRSPA